MKDYRQETVFKTCPEVYLRCCSSPAMLQDSILGLPCGSQSVQNMSAVRGSSARARGRAISPAIRVDLKDRASNEGSRRFHNHGKGST